ncbi:PRC-barrel domain-containing protein [Roseomonas genomospecies 6]|uniref:PRC-barrel domain containing protein n=1 Tax=Roseomonas genomospecies 6 TaxID=214106 RepID=A0A9W7NIS4_9PROT|nr:PRC-barrel domain-containing protein [Roseomonas genomospecies 6]KAA0679947.1 PRC-barrel domain containing protein [Roseomonas genomospecies 6]
MRKLLSVAAAVFVLVSVEAAHAQQSAAIPNPANAYREVKDNNVMVPALNQTVGQLDDMDVMGSDGKKIGEVEEVLMDSSGQPVAVVVDVERDVGIGGKEVIVGLDQLRSDGRNLTTTLSNAQLGALPVWKD